MNMFRIEGNNELGTNTELLVEDPGHGKDKRFHIGTYDLDSGKGCFISLNRKQVKQLRAVLGLMLNDGVLVSED